MTTSNKQNSDLEVNSTYTVIEYIDETLESDYVSTKSALSSISIEKDVEQIELTKATGRFVALSATVFFIKQGEAKAFKVPVGSGVTLLDINLNWGNKNNSLKLTNYPPTGGSRGSYYDNSGGVADGRIVLRIKPPAGGKYVRQGDWKFEVYGNKVNGTEDYTFKAVAHIPN